MLPEWLSIKPASREKYNQIKERISQLSLHTVCVEAHCPNMSECWSSGTATFMVLGDLCTRGCRFCTVSKSAKGINVDNEEPGKLATLIKEWNLDYIVITSVCRDDLKDQGASHFASCISEIKQKCGRTVVEVLIPDFRGDEYCLKMITDAEPDVIGHNIETVKRLNPIVRDKRANYDQSISVLKRSKELNKRIFTKSAIMLGLGETEDEIVEAMHDLREADADFLALGQYLRPTGAQVEVNEYVKPERFDHLKKIGIELGFKYVAAGPFVRSSYKAGEFFIKSMVLNRQ